MASILAREKCVKSLCHYRTACDTSGLCILHHTKDYGYGNKRKERKQHMPENKDVPVAVSVGTADVGRHVISFWLRLSFAGYTKTSS